MTRKRRTGEELKGDILKYLEKQTFPRTTGQIAVNMRINWDSANSYLRKLKDEGILYHEKVGRQNQWCLMEYYMPWKKRLEKRKII